MMSLAINAHINMKLIKYHLKNSYLVLLSIAFMVLSGCSEKNSSPGNVSNITAKKFFDNFIAQHPDTVAYKSETKSYKWNYEQGLILEAFYRMWVLSGEHQYYDYLKKNIDYYVQPDGKIITYKLEDYNLDNIAPGRQLLHLYNETGDEKYRKTADVLMKQIQNQPRTSEGGFWHKKRYPYQMWLDGLYMAEPFYAKYIVMFGSKKDFDDIAKQFLMIRKYHKDDNTGLYHHGWDESRDQKWADPETGKSPSFWGRSIGWFMMAMIDVLDSFPAEHPNGENIKKMFKDLSRDLLNFRDKEKKLWYQVIDQGDRDGNYIETSSSLMFIYSYARGFNKGYLPEEYFNIAQESFKYITDNFVTLDEDNLFYLQNTVSVGGLGGDPYRDGSFEYYISEPIRINDFKGYGPLLLAAIELEKKQRTE